MTLSEFESRTTGAKPKTFKNGLVGFVSECPCCESVSKHLAAWDGKDGYWHISCIKHCLEDDILHSLGLRQEDRRIETKAEGTPKPSDDGQCSIYVDANGKPIFKKTKYYSWKDGWKKGFKQHGVNGEPDLKHLKLACKPLYRLPEVLAAIKAGKPVVINEGEKASDLCWERGIPATCQPDGAGPGKWQPGHTKQLKGLKEAIVVADRDDMGVLYAPQVYASLNDAGIPTKVVRSKTKGAKDDLWDHLKAGGTLEDIETADDLMPEVIRTRRKASKIETSIVPWLCYPYFAKGMLAGIEGDPGIGKSYVCASLATAVSVGAKLPFCEEAFPKGNVMMYMSEDSSEFTTVPRLQHFGADLDRIDVEEDVFPLDSFGLERIRRDILETRAILVIIDPISAFIEATKNGKQTLDVHGLMTSLKQIAAETGACIVCLRHLRKSSGADTNPLYSGLGDISIVGKYRTALQIRKHPEKKGQCVVVHFKSNIGPTGPPFAYEVRHITRDEVDFVWINGEVDLSAAELAGKKDEGQALNAAKEFLLDLLTNNYVLKDDVMAKAKELNLSERTVWRAKDALKMVHISKHGFADNRYRWVIKMPVALTEEEYDAFGDSE